MRKKACTGMANGMLNTRQYAQFHDCNKLKPKQHGIKSVYLYTKLSTI